jgi:hypothetical protein
MLIWAIAAGLPVALFGIVLLAPKGGGQRRQYTLETFPEAAEADQSGPRAGGHAL